MKTIRLLIVFVIICVSLTSCSNNTESSTNYSEQTHTHNFSQATCSKPKTCSCGVTEGYALPHEFVAATCEDPEHCKNCGLITAKAIGHSYFNDTCTECNAKITIPFTVKIDNPLIDNHYGISYELTYNIKHVDRYESGECEILITSKRISGTNPRAPINYYINYYDSNNNIIDYGLGDVHSQIGVETMSYDYVPKGTVKIIIVNND